MPTACALPHEAPRSRPRHEPVLRFSGRGELGGGRARPGDAAAGPGPAAGCLAATASSIGRPADCGQAGGCHRPGASQADRRQLSQGPLRRAGVGGRPPALCGCLHARGCGGDGSRRRRRERERPRGRRPHQRAPGLLRPGARGVCRGSRQRRRRRGDGGAGAAGACEAAGQGPRGAGAGAGALGARGGCRGAGMVQGRAHLGSACLRQHPSAPVGPPPDPQRRPALRTALLTTPTHAVPSTPPVDPPSCPPLCTATRAWGCTPARPRRRERWTAACCCATAWRPPPSSTTPSPTTCTCWVRGRLLVAGGCWPVLGGCWPASRVLLLALGQATSGGSLRGSALINALPPLVAGTMAGTPALPSVRSCAPAPLPTQTQRRWCRRSSAGCCRRPCCLQQHWNRCRCPPVRPRRPLQRSLRCALPPCSRALCTTSPPSRRSSLRPRWHPSRASRRLPSSAAPQLETLGSGRRWRRRPPGPCSGRLRPRLAAPPPGPLRRECGWRARASKCCHPPQRVHDLISHQTVRLIVRSASVNTPLAHAHVSGWPG